MRINQYRNLYKAMNIQILEENLRPGSLADLDKVTLCSPYNAFKKEDVAVSHGYIVSQ